MPIPQYIRRILLALASLVAMLGALAGTAYAEYGELGSPVVETGNVETSSLKPHVFGIEPATGNFYVGDEITQINGGKEEHFYRIQKFGSGGGEALGEAKIKVNPKSEALTDAALEGIAIDPGEKRFYVLVDREREPEPEPEPGEEPVFDPETPAAANLYAFSTEANGQHELEQDKEVNLQPQSETPRAALLDPHGIAIDSKNGDVVILGQEDEQTTKGDAPELRAAAQFVTSKGKLGPRYVDLENCLDEGTGGEPACAEGSASQPFSPIVTPEGKVLVERRGEIWEMPPTKEVESGRFETLPKRLLPLESKVEVGPEQKLLAFPAASEGLGEDVGGTMSFAPEGAAGEGKIYLTAGISTESNSKTVTSAGAVVLSYAEPGGVAEAKELGWMGGEAEGGGQCSIPKVGNSALLIGGGEHEDVFLFDAHAKTGDEHPAGVALFKFGSGGTGCPHASVTEPSVKVKNNQGVEVEVSKIPLGETTTLSSAVTEGNAKSVEWKFKNLETGKEEVKSEAEETEAKSYQFETTSLKHKFEEAGKYKITEIVETDNLASSKIEVTREMLVEATPLAVEFSYPASVIVGRGVKFEATVTDLHELGTPHLKYTWKFGDGEEKSGETTATAFSEEHTYHAEGEKSVTLKVTDAHGVIGEITHTISVAKEEEHKSEEHKSEEQKTEEHKEEHKTEAPPKTESPPEATLSSTSLGVSPAGAVTLEVSCPLGDSNCSGSVTLRTLGAVAARTAGRRSKGKHKVVLTLATGSFTVVGGQAQAVTLHLSAAARSLLAHSHVLRVQATIVARDPAGASHTTQMTVTLRAVAKSKRHRKR